MRLGIEDPVIETEVVMLLEDEVKVFESLAHPESLYPVSHLLSSFAKDGVVFSRNDVPPWSRPCGSLDTEHLPPPQTPAQSQLPGRSPPTYATRHFDTCDRP